MINDKNYYEFEDFQSILTKDFELFEKVSYFCY